MILTRTRIVNAATATLVIAALGACTDTRRALGIDKVAPDEFNVVARAPLTVPPEFILRPPQPGAVRPQEATAESVAKQTVFRVPEAKPAPAAIADGTNRSTAELALLQQAGAVNVDPKIRDQVNQEMTKLFEADRTFIDRLVFWQKQDEPGTVIDASKEAQRLRENAALGKQVTAGDTPIIQRRKRGILEGIFN